MLLLSYLPSVNGARTARKAENPFLSFIFYMGTVTLTPKLSYVFCFYYIASDIEEPFLYVVDPLIFSSFVFSGPFRDITNPMALVWSNRVIFLAFNLLLCHIYLGYWVFKSGCVTQKYNKFGYGILNPSNQTFCHTKERIKDLIANFVKHN